MADPRSPIISADLVAYAEAHTSASPAAAALTADAAARTDRSIMLSDRPLGRLLAILSATLRPRLAVDVGTFTGHSAACLAEGLAPNGRVVTCEVDASQAETARALLANHPRAAQIEVVVGDAVATLRDLAGPIDLAFIDGDKAQYLAYYELVLARLAPRGLILVDNTLYFGRVLRPSAEQPGDRWAARFGDSLREFNDAVVADPRVESTLLTISDGVTLIRRRDPIA